MMCALERKNRNWLEEICARCGSVAAAAAMYAFVSARIAIVCTVKIRRNLKYFQRKFKVKPSFV